MLFAEFTPAAIG